MLTPPLEVVCMSLSSVPWPGLVIQWQVTPMGKKHLSMRERAPVSQRAFL